MLGELVSAVITAYNYGRYVCDAVESVLAQTYTPIEIIVVDDGSTDDTRERLAPYSDRIRYIHQCNQGVSAARNTGIRAARGEYVAFLDADDRWHPRRLEVQMRYVSANPTVGLLGANHFSGPFVAWPEVGDPDRVPVFHVTLRQMLIRSRIGLSSSLVRRDCFDAVGCFDTSLPPSTEDRDLWIRIASRYPVVNLEAPLWWYRLHQGSVSTAAVRMEQNELKVLLQALETQEAVRGDSVLRRRVLSYTLKSAAYRYAASGAWMKAIGRVLRSLALWPFPYTRDERITRFERPKMLTLFLLRMLRSKLALSAKSAPNT